MTAPAAMTVQSNAVSVTTRSSHGRGHAAASC